MRVSRVFRATIKGEPSSKESQRRTTKPSKSISYQDQFIKQMPEKNTEELYLEDVGIILDIYYKSRRPNLDENLVLDLLRGRAYKDERQVKIKLIRHHLDKKNPRTIIQVFAINDSVRSWWGEIEMMSTNKGERN